MVYFLSRHLFAPLFISRIKVIGGLKNLPPKGPYLVVANHISYLDPPVLGSLIAKQTNEKVHFITKKEIYRHFGNLIGKRWLGMIPIDENDKEKCLKMAQDYLNQGKIVGVFPEGGRFSSRELKKGKTGAARLALCTKCPVIPVGFRGPADKNPKDAFRLFFSRKNEIKVEIGKPLDLNKFYNQETTHELLKEVTGIIQKAISRLCGKEYFY